MPPHEDLIPGSIQDDYPGYVLDTFGYQYDALELLDPPARRRHDALARATPEALRAASPQDALEWLAAAHRWLELGELDQLTQALETILTLPPHASVALDEVLEHLVLLCVQRGEPGRVRELLERPPEWAAEGARLPLLKGLLALALGDESAAESALSSYTTHETDAPERCYEVAEFMAAQGAHGASLRWLERARNEAERAGDSALLVDIRLLSVQQVSSEEE